MRFMNLITGNGYPVKKWCFDVEQVSRWLLSLPKPIALFACDDYYALQITEVCKMYDISIPEEIAVLGVDNDKLLCNISDPQLSSIELDIENGGYEAGKLLHQFIEKEDHCTSRYYNKTCTDRPPVPLRNVLPYPTDI